MFKPALIATCLLLATPMAQPQSLPSQPPDNAGGARAHLGYSAAMGALGSLVAPEHPWLVFAACLAVGVVKEALDYRRGQSGYRHGLFSRNDIRNDGVGCAAGLGGITLIRSTF